MYSLMCMYLLYVYVMGSHHYPSSTVRADISDITTEPYSPIAGTNERCLRAGSEVKIVCENVAFPVAEVTFFKNGIAINTSTERCAFLYMYMYICDLYMQSS